jgi:hypothetical protein
MEECMRTPLVLSTLLVLALAGCMTERVPSFAEHPSIPKQSTFLVKKIGFDAHGRPLFGDRVGSRPGSAGDQFTVVQAINDRPVRSYDIAIVEQPKTGPGPLAVIYLWTGKGFEGGLAITSGFVRHVSLNSQDQGAYLAITAVPIVIGTVTGFMVGVLASIPETANELKRVVVNTRETVISSLEFIYDEKGRIRFMKLYPPVERVEALVKTEFFYEGDGDAPARTEVTSVAEKKVRVVR